VTAVVALLSAVAFSVVSAPASEGAATTVPLGFYVGAGAPRLVHAIASASGTHPTLADDYLVGSYGWNGLVNQRQIDRILKPWKRSGYRIVLGVPMLPTLSGSPVGTLASGARGAYDRNFRALAQHLVAVGQRNAILRIGWEFNGNWETWSVPTATDAANFAGFFRQIVTTMRKVSPDFEYVWNVSDGSSTTSLLRTAYPGNKYVDFIGDDVYDESCESNPTPQGAWKSLLTANAGLDWAAHFATTHGKHVAIPEWGISGTGGSCGLGDDPYFIKKMAAWLTKNDAAFSVYFDFDAGDGSHRLQDASYPKSLAAFRRAF
jgi:hypothetical protein